MARGFDALLTVCFGTADPVVLDASFLSVHRQACAAFPGVEHAFALSSAAIHSALSRQGYTYLSPQEALCDLARRGAQRFLVLPLLLADGREWNALNEWCKAQRPHVAALRLLPPLLRRQYGAVARTLDTLFAPHSGVGTVLLGHGGTPQGDAQYARLQQELAELGRTDLFVVLLHQTDGAERAKEYFDRLGINTLSLRFLMLCAGRHARDTVSLPGGLAHSLRKNGFTVRSELSGLGTEPEFGVLFTVGLTCLPGLPYDCTPNCSVPTFN